MYGKNGKGQCLLAMAGRNGHSVAIQSSTQVRVCHVDFASKGFAKQESIWSIEIELWGIVDATRLFYMWIFELFMYSTGTLRHQLYCRMTFPFDSVSV